MKRTFIAALLLFSLVPLATGPQAFAQVNRVQADDTLPTSPVRQTSFDRQQTGNDVTYSVGLIDHDDRAQRLTFGIPRSAIESARASQRPYSRAELNQRVEAAVRAAAASEQNVGVTFQRVGEELRYVAQAPNAGVLNAVMPRLDAARVKATEDYLSELMLKDQGGRLLRDYKAAVDRYAQSLHQLAAAIASAAGPDDRAKLSLALAFFQAIPYDPQMGRFAGGSNDFEAPPVVVDGNRGDSDSKAAALAAVLRLLMPNYATAVIELNGRSLLGINMVPDATDYAVTTDNRRWVVMEPAGPVGLRPGMIYLESRVALDARRIERVVPVTP